jgi:hypothetical protein
MVTVQSSGQNAGCEVQCLYGCHTNYVSRKVLEYIGKKYHIQSYYKVSG